MEEGRILIPSDPVAFDIMRRRAADPDAFTRAKIAEFEKGERGNPVIPEAIKTVMGTGK